MGIFFVKMPIVHTQTQENHMQINPDYNTAAFTIRAYNTGEVIVYEPVSKKLNTPTEDGKPRINTSLLKMQTL